MFASTEELRAMNNVVDSVAEDDKVEGGWSSQRRGCRLGPRNSADVSHRSPPPPTSYKTHHESYFSLFLCTHLWCISSSQNWESKRFRYGIQGWNELKEHGWWIQVNATTKLVL